MTDTVVFRVPAMRWLGVHACRRTRAADRRGVDEAAADLEGKTVTVRGTHLDEGALRAAIEEAGYKAEP